ncbi:MAG TPA: secretion protein HlyD, partial [Thermoanaerobaculia bacterium]
MAATNKSRLKRIVLIVVIVIGAIALLVYMRQKRQPKALVLSGTLEARTVNVGSLVGGRVTR